VQSLYYFYISQTKSNLDNIFYKVVYHHIIYMYESFFDEFRRLFYYDFAHISMKRIVSVGGLPEKFGWIPEHA
jgi:hypothetical protein